MLRPTARAAAALAWLLAGTAGAQPPQPGGAPPQPQGQPVRFEDLPPAIRLGLRVEAVRRSVPVISAVVLVKDEVSFIEAVAHWSPKIRYPVLYDDGTPLAHEDIARFVRAFKPARVVRWSAPEPGAGDAPGRRDAIDRAVVRSWDAETPAEFVARLNELKIAPPGVVVASTSDPAWTAALALAAARAQPILWAEVAGGVSDDMPLEEASRFCSVLEGSCDKIGAPWRDLGDAIDAVTICLNGPAKVRVGPDKLVAATDFIGRRRIDGAASRETGARWAWAGQVHGSEAQASYRAMCAIFLSARSAWLFDGYPAGAPWNTFDATRAAEFLREGTPAIEAAVDDMPRGDRLHWLRRCAKPLDAGLVLVNSKGLANVFETEPGACRPGDIPVLSVPAAVHFVHSWSAAWPSDRSTVAGRWLERGAYAYTGSVQEPFLQAFVPTPIFAARMVSSFPWGAAGRQDSGPAWRIAIFGDPLMTFGPGAPASDAELPSPLDSAEDIASGLAPALKEKRFAEALDLLTLLGRDADAARLAGGVLRDKPAAFTPEVARAAIPPLFRAGTLDDLIAAFNQTGLTEQGPPTAVRRGWGPLPRRPARRRSMRRRTRGDPRGWLGARRRPRRRRGSRRRRPCRRSCGARWPRRRKNRPVRRRPARRCPPVEPARFRTRWPAGASGRG